MKEEVLYAIFLELHKVYDGSDREIFLELLEGYGVGPRSPRILRVYWNRLRMVAQSGD